MSETDVSELEESSLLCPAKTSSRHPLTKLRIKDGYYWCPYCEITFGEADQ